VPFYFDQEVMCSNRCTGELSHNSFYLFQIGRWASAKIYPVQLLTRAARNSSSPLARPTGRPTCANLPPAGQVAGLFQIQPPLSVYFNLFANFA
jgi:hypothetical protein